MMTHQEKYRQELEKIRDKYQLRKYTGSRSNGQENVAVPAANLHKHYQVFSHKSKQQLGNSLIYNQPANNKSMIFQNKYKKEDQLQNKIQQYQNNYRQSLIIAGQENMKYKQDTKAGNISKLLKVKNYQKKTQYEKPPNYLNKYKEALQKAYQYGKQIGFRFRKLDYQDQQLKGYQRNREKVQINKIYWEKNKINQNSQGPLDCTTQSRFDTSFSFGKDKSPQKQKQQKAYYDSPIKIIKQAEKQQARQQQEQAKTKSQQPVRFESDIIKLKPIQMEQDKDITRLDNIRSRIDNYILRNKLKY